ARVVCVSPPACRGDRGGSRSSNVQLAPNREMPEMLNHLVPRNRSESALLRKLGASFELPMAEFGDGFLTFANPLDLTEHFERVGPFRIERDFDVIDFMENGSADAGIESRDAKSIMMNLLRQAWEKHCAREGFLAHTFSSGL